MFFLLLCPLFDSVRTVTAIRHWFVPMAIEAGNNSSNCRHTETTSPEIQPLLTINAGRTAVPLRVVSTRSLIVKAFSGRRGYPL